MSITILGAGAFGTALAVTIGRERPLTLWARDTKALIDRRESPRLPGAVLPENVSVTADLDTALCAQTILFAMPMQALAPFASGVTQRMSGKALVACCKGIDLSALHGPAAVLAGRWPEAQSAILTGPSFAADIAHGLPTALTLASADEEVSKQLQALLSTSSLRLYRTTDVVGAELGGALKNVIAIAAGIVVGAGLGDSARAALMTRGFAELSRFAAGLGARTETLMGLSGFGDLILTCTSQQSRNFRHGLALGAGTAPDPRVTVEGVATAEAVMRRAKHFGIVDEMPLTAMVAQVTQGQMTVAQAIRSLMSRPLKEE